jgi:hypothetical protein
LIEPSSFSYSTVTFLINLASVGNCIVARFNGSKVSILFEEIGTSFSPEDGKKGFSRALNVVNNSIEINVIFIK